MSARHEHRRAARRAHRPAIMAQHGRSLFTVDAAGNPLFTVRQDPSGYFPADSQLAVMTGVAPTPEQVGAWCREVYPKMAATHTLWTPHRSGDPAAVVGAACEHIRLQTAQHFDFLSAELLRMFVQYPTGWLVWLAAPIERPTT